MILEIATLTIKSGMESAFETGVTSAVAAFKAAKGCHGMELQRSHEVPNRYLLFVRWDSVEAHMVDFRESPEFQVWRKAVGHCFEAPPTVEHVITAVHGFGGTVGD
ncbi:antibiotic biosynthesis monooxygenase [Beijerinckia sp. L45]|uniref:antibiotic biosynthesis monooxygenase family protein n=1 Tax=Beijerinckia sp. L45 TaxID=1641855 RepID=UPI00131D41DA|nr:antibiotic biosynthesis monooxygenase family protein [Beijerinckia sp. L45]